jgi:carbonic anhydrase
MIIPAGRLLALLSTRFCDYLPDHTYIYSKKLISGYMNRLIAVKSPDDILPEYRNTPVETLFEYHNFKQTFGSYKDSKMLIGMCMDKRKHLHIPDNFAFIIRTGGANLRYSEFKVSYAIAVGGVRCIALIGHNNCGMVNLISRKQQFVDGLVDATGWDRTQADNHFRHFAPMFEIGDEKDFVLSEVKRLRLRYPKILVAPLFYILEDNLLYLIREP